MNISEVLREAARNDQPVTKLCDEWYDGWGHPTKEELVNKYIKGQDFCIENNFPSNEIIKKYFGEIAESEGVFTDNNHVDLHNPPVVILNGNCKADILLNEFHTCDIYIKHNSQANIMVEENAKVFVRMYHNSSVTISSNGYSQSFVYKHGGEIFSSGNVKIRER